MASGTSVLSSAHIVFLGACREQGRLAPPRLGGLLARFAAWLIRSGLYVVRKGDHALAILVGKDNDILRTFCGGFSLSCCSRAVCFRPAAFWHTSSSQSTAGLKLRAITPQSVKAGVPVNATATPEKEIVVDLAKGMRVPRVPVEAVAETRVRESAAPLKIQPIPPQTIEAGKQLSVVVAVEDPQQAKDIRYSLTPGDALGATIDPQSGEFSWTPPRDQTAGRYDVAVSAQGSRGQRQTTFLVTVTKLPRRWKRKPRPTSPATSPQRKRPGLPSRTGSPPSAKAS